MKPATGNDLLRFFFATGGRIPREEYALGLVFIYAVNAALIAFSLHQADRDLALGLTIMISTFPTTLALVVLAAKRCRDIGISAWLAVIALIPVFGFLWLVTLVLVPGRPEASDREPPPRFDPD